MQYRLLTASAVLALSLAPLRAQELPVPNASPASPAAAPAIPYPTTPETPAPIEPPVPAVSSEIVVTPGAGNAQPVPIAPPVSQPATMPLSGAPAAPTSPAGVAVPNQNFSEFSDDDLTQVLRLLARQAKISLFISDQISNTQPPIKVTVRLENKTPLDAMQVIVESKGLILDRKDDVYYVKTKGEKDAEPQVPGSYTFSYASAEKVLPLLGSQLVSHSPAQFDARTNTIFYREVKSNVDNIKLFLESIDRPTQQVMIEARLVEVTANPRQSYGINWAGVVGSSGAAQTFRFGATTPGTNGLVSTPNTDPTKLPTQGVNIASLPTVVTTNNKFTPQEFMWSEIAGRLQPLGGQFAILSAPAMSLTMRLLNEDADAEFLANPRVVTANNQEATIKITRNQPVPELTFNDQTATSVFNGFKDKNFGNTLKVTPIINKDDFITLTVNPEISNKVGDSVFNFGGAQVSSPIIDTRQLTSQVLIHSGDTLAIGGLLQDEVTKGSTKVPVLGDIPVIGYAFQEKINQRTKRNLLIFVTPTLVKQGYGTGLENQVSGLKNSGEEYADPNGWRNNAKGALRVVPTSNRALPADYPKPGTPLAPVRYKVSAPDRER